MITKDALIRGARTGLWTFVGVFSVSLLGFLTAVADWAGSVDKAFPSINPLGKAAVAALCAAASGFVGMIVNGYEDYKHANGILGAKAKPEVEPEQGGGYPEGEEASVSGETSNPGAAASGTYYSNYVTGRPSLTKEEVEELLDENRKKLMNSIRAQLNRSLTPR